MQRNTPKTLFQDKSSAGYLSQLRDRMRDKRAVDTDSGVRPLPRAELQGERAPATSATDEQRSRRTTPQHGRFRSSAPQGAPVPPPPAGRAASAPPAPPLPAGVPRSPAPSRLGRPAHLGVAAPATTARPRRQTQPSKLKRAPQPPQAPPPFRGDAEMGPSPVAVRGVDSPPASRPSPAQIPPLVPSALESAPSPFGTDASREMWDDRTEVLLAPGPRLSRGTPADSSEQVWKIVLVVSLGVLVVCGLIYLL